MTGNPSGPMNLAENPLPRSHAHGRRHKEAAAAVFTARDLGADPTIVDAALAGRVQVKQARGIVKAGSGRL